MRECLKKLRLQWRCRAAIPLPPKKTVEEHMANLAELREKTLAPLLESTRSGNGHVCFVAAAHFVPRAFLCCLWCVCRLFIRGASGRQRYSVLGDWNAVTNELDRVTTAGTVSSETMRELLHKIAALGLTGPITLVLDNARHQRCELVTNLAATLHINLQC